MLLKTEEKAKSFSLYNLTGFVFNAAIVILFVVYFRMGALGKISADLLYAVVASAFFIRLVRKSIACKFSFRAIKDTLRFGLPLVPHQVSLWIINLSDRYCLQLFGSLAMAGVYSIGYNITFPISFLSSSIGMAWTPSFFKTAHEKGSKIDFARMTTYYIMIVLFLALAIAVFSNELTVLIATPNYYSASVVIPVIALGYFFHSLYKIFTKVLVYAKQTVKLSFCTMASAFVNILLNILWIPRYGMKGAAWATLIAFVILFLLSYAFSRKYYNVPYEYPRITGLFFLAVIIYFLSEALKQANISAGGIMFKICLLGAYVLFLCKSKFFTLDEKQKFRLILCEKLKLNR